MGKTPQPLRIVVLPPLTEEKWVKELEEKGHEITRVTPDMVTQMPPGEVLEKAHLILGPNCHFFHPSFRVKDVEQALKWARKQAYPRKKKGDKPDGATS